METSRHPGGDRYELKKEKNNWQALATISVFTEKEVGFFVYVSAYIKDANPCRLKY